MPDHKTKLDHDDFPEMLELAMTAVRVGLRIEEFYTLVRETLANVSFQWQANIVDIELDHNCKVRFVFYRGTKQTLMLCIWFGENNETKSRETIQLYNAERDNADKET